jgi:glyoxylase-like metal-dependent hydrolase (beta-lactamase superfamily II)
MIRFAAASVPAAFFALAVLAPAPAAATLDDIAKAMGADKVQTLRLSGAGTFWGVGQAARPGVNWPRFNLVRATRSFDYGKGALRHDYVVTQAEKPPRGGSLQPVYGEQPRVAGLDGDRAWTMAGPFALAAPALANSLRHDLWITPHGIVKAAQADKAKRVGNAFDVARAGAFKARATVDKRGLVVRVESWVGNPVLGDMAVVTTYDDYRAVGGVMVPHRIRQSAGGHPVLDMTVSEAKVNDGGVTTPDSIRSAPAIVSATKAAEGVWFLAGGTHHSIAIEMQDHVVVFEGPLGDGRALAVIAETKKLIPGKPIRYVVNTHHHFDHSGGLRAFAAEGATIVTHAINRAYFERAYAAPRSLEPDAMAKAGKAAKFLPVGEKLVLTDGARRIELHHLKGNLHNDGLIVGYLPKEKILLVADAFSPREPITRVPANLSPFTTNLYQNLLRLKLDVETVLPIHGRLVSVKELRLEAGVAQ